MSPLLAVADSPLVPKTILSDSARELGCQCSQPIWTFGLISFGHISRHHDDDRERGKSHLKSNEAEDHYFKANQKSWLLVLHHKI